MYNTCLTGVLGRKTRVLVTNQLQFVSGADHILYMQDGHIEEQGTYDELIKADQGFAQLMSQAEVSCPLYEPECDLFKQGGHIEEQRTSV